MTIRLKVYVTKHYQLFGAVSPEARPGPSDSNYLFDDFIAMINEFKERSVILMPKRDDIKTILVIGSGPIIIGQAAG